MLRELKENMNQELRMKPGVVVHACKPSYLGGRDQEDHISRPAQAKNVSEIPSQQTSQVRWEHGCIPNYTRSISRKIRV
jgi:hypothetical protein